MKRVHVVVRGRVQGVFFRASTRQRARALGVSGFARNCPDGSVECVFEGEPASVDALVQFVREGPDLARVDQCQVDEEPPRGDAKAFEIR